MNDTQRLNWLIAHVEKEGGIVLHLGGYSGGVPSYSGLAFGGRSTRGRTLREAIDSCAKHDGLDAPAE